MVITALTRNHVLHVDTLLMEYQRFQGFRLPEGLELLAFSPDFLSVFQRKNRGEIALEWYRSGHNGADSKSVCRLAPARGFESHPLRHRPSET